MQLRALGLSVAAVIGIAVIAVEWIIRVLTLLYTPRNRRPQTALAWLLAIFLLPFFPFIGKAQRPDLRNHRKLLVVAEIEAVFISDW